MESFDNLSGQPHTPTLQQRTHARTLIFHSSHPDIIIIIIVIRTRTRHALPALPPYSPAPFPLVIPFSSPFPASAALEPPKGKRRWGGALSWLSGASSHHRCSL